MCGERICGLISAFKYNPDALPFSFGRICAPSGTSAWCAMLETHLIPRALSRSFNDASSSAFLRNSKPSNLATTSRVMSSLVGPSPPVTKTISARENNSRRLFAVEHGTINRDFSDIFPTRHVIQDVEHDPLEHRAKRASTGTLRDRLRGQSAQRVFGHRQPYTFHREELGVLLDHSVLCLSQNCHHLFFS